ncbi:MAG: 3'(2'),5'-bisphosphate nucleotidase CysQ [Xanthobacteraceae bacterium]|nr:3'(2'),5'-bisphosphate nucleotidase CysQ [Xanthobacteraceae bacterium]
MNRAERTRILNGMIEAAAEAGTKIREMAATGVVARSKPDASPVTDADEAAEAIIERHLDLLLPGVPMIGEEAVAGGSKTKPGSTFFLVDPIDGTRDFIAKREGYTVNIALLLEGTPALGVIYAPALGELYAGGADGAFRWPLVPGIKVENVPEERIRVRTPPKNVVACVSHSHLDTETTGWLKKRGISETVKIGSSIKFCRVAEGKADVYPRLAPVSEWDIAAGHAILMAAGGSVKTPDGSPLHYGKRKEDYEVESFIASGGAQF